MARHPNKEIHAALIYAQSRGWHIVKSRKGGCQKSIWSTPREPQNHAKAIRRYVDGCPHASEETDN